MPDNLDPTIRIFQQRIAAAYAEHPGFAELPPAERRRIAEQVRGPWRIGGPAMRHVEELRVGDREVRIRVLRPTRAPALPALLYLHGGGWTMFSLDTHDRLMREYAARAGVAVIGIDYSLAPEARFPAAIEEIVSVIAWLRRDGAALGVDPARLAIGGDSAGANLAVAASLALREAGAPPLAALLLNYGAFAGRPDGHASYARFGGEAYNLTAAEMAGFWRDYAREESDLANPLASPLLADLHNLPPSFFTIAECDVLADENIALAERMRAAGVPVEARVHGGAAHSFLEAISISPLAERAVDEGAAWLRERLAPSAVLLVGAGRMGQAFLRGWQGLADASFFDPAVEALENARKLDSLDAAADLPRPLLVMIAVKPQIVPKVLPDLARLAGPDTLFLSIAAGIEIASLEAGLGEAAHIVRAMPNTPVSVGRGITAAVASPNVDAGQRETVERLLGAVGELVWLDDEAGLNAVTAVSGSGPAYFFRFAEVLAEAGIRAGLPAETASRLARATLSGAGALAAARGEALAELRIEVTSPGGTTAAALALLDAAGLDAIVTAAVQAAVARAEALARENG